GDGAGLLFGLDRDRANTIGSAIYAIAQGRFVDVLKQEMPDRLLSKVISLASDREIASLPDKLILSLFMSESDEVRKTLSVKSIRAISKRRLRRLLERYMRLEERRYYNVIHWLDLGVSLPRSRVTAAADYLLMKLD